MRIGKAGALEIGHGIGLAPDHIIQDPEAEILQDRADAENIVIAADHPKRTVIFQDALGLGHPLDGELIIGLEAGELVPGIVDGIDLGIVGPVQIAAQLQIIGRVGKDQIHRLVRDLGHLRDTITEYQGFRAKGHKSLPARLTSSAATRLRTYVWLWLIIANGGVIVP